MPKSSAQPEILSPLKPGAPGSGRFTAANQLFRNENLDMLAHLLDDCFRIPGTSIRFGVDGIIGLIPGLGDVFAGLASSLLVIAAWARGVPYVTLARMVVNLGIDVLIGSIPILGDAFDIAWKANRRNYALITRHLNEPRHNHWRDWLFLAGIALVLLLTCTLPIIVFVALVDWYLLKK
jgi:hypothetical protein